MSLASSLPKLSLDGKKVNLPTSLPALKETLVNLIENDNYQRAQLIINALPQFANDSSILTEVAYIYYKLNNHEKLSEITPSTIALKHIFAQYYYSNGENDKALQLYNSINSSRDANDIAVNIRAVISQKLYLSNNNVDISIDSLPSSDIPSYDELFNDALIQIFSNNLTNAQNLLEKAKNLAINSVSNYPQLDAFIELAPIDLQIAYVYILQKNISKSNDILDDISSQLTSLLNQYPKNKNLQIINLILQNNKLSIIDNESVVSPYLIFRELNFPNSIEETRLKLTIPQLSIFNRNELLLSNQINKTSKNTIKKFIENNPNNITFSSSSPINKLLQKVQKFINKNNNQGAIAYLESSIDIVKQHTSLIVLLVTLYESINASNKVQSFLSSIVSSPSSNESINEELLKFIQMKLNKDVKSIPINEEHLSSLISDIDVNSLNFPTFNNSNNQKSKPKMIKKRKNHNKKPKNTHSKIDPERWLPLKDRSYYKSKNKKKTQGGTVDSGLSI